MTVAVRPSVRLFALVPVLVAVGSVVLDVVFLEFFGAFLLPLLSQLVYVGVGLLLTLRLPRQPVGWLLLWAGALFQLAFAAGAYKWAAFIRAPGTLPLGEVALLIGIAWLPALGCLFLAIMLFPTGRPPSPRWRLPAAVVVMATALGLVAELLGPREFPVQPSPFGAQGALPLTVANPLAIDGPLGTLLGYVGAFPLVVYLIPVAAVLVRFRTAAGTERQQLKWFAYAASIVMVFFVATGFGLFSYLGGVLASLVAVVVMDLIPISVAIAILRYRLYDIDLIISRALVYIPLTGLLGGLYAASVALFQRVFIALTGDRSDGAIVITTLILAGTFTPVRKALEGAVDARFRPARAAQGAASGLPVRLGDPALRAEIESVAREGFDSLVNERAPRSPDR